MQTLKTFHYKQQKERQEEEKRDKKEKTKTQSAWDNERESEP